MGKLKLIAQQMVSAGKGILAADESTPTCTKRFEQHQIKSTELSRNQYRSTLFTTNNLEKYISGIILFDETFNQNILNTELSIPLFLKQKGILTGIKVDIGAKDLANHKDEKITEGLDGLKQRLLFYKKKGADFAKWRAVIKIGQNIPSRACIHSNAHSLARYASLCQENEIVPIVEPEVIMDGKHTIKSCYQATEQALRSVFEQLNLLNVNLEGMILKPNMILPGSESLENCEELDIIKATYEVLMHNVPNEVPGIAFLSGGQSSDLAAQRLNHLNQYAKNKNPWKLTFSYGRALQQDALSKWANSSNKKAQDALIIRAKMNSLASKGLLDVN